MITDQHPTGTTPTKPEISQPFNFTPKLHLSASLSWNPNSFLIHESLGSGAFGVVYRATIKESGFVIAIKQVHVGSRSDGIEKEIEMLRNCRHPNIVQYFVCSFVDDSIWV